MPKWRVGFSKYSLPIPPAVHTQHGGLARDPDNEAQIEIHASKVEIMAHGALVFRDSIGTIQRAFAAGVWLEITMLIMPGTSDTP